MLVSVNRDARDLVPARGNDSKVGPCRPIEPQSTYVQIGPGAPGVTKRVVDLGDRRRGGKSASVEVEFPVEDGAARPCHWLRHGRTGGPRVSSDVVDVQRVQFNGEVVTTGNVQLAVDDPEPRQNQRLRQGGKRGPAIAGDVVSVERVHCPTSIVTGSHVNNPIPQRRGLSVNAAGIGAPVVQVFVATV